MTDPTHLRALIAIARKKAKRLDAELHRRVGVVSCEADTLRKCADTLDQLRAENAKLVEALVEAAIPLEAQFWLVSTTIRRNCAMGSSTPPKLSAQHSRERNDMSEQREEMLHQSRMNATIEAEEMSLVAVLRPRIMIDGNQWCILFGENLQDGVAGFGDSPYLAALDFRKAWHQPLEKNP